MRAASVEELQALRACAIREFDGVLYLDRDSECYRKLRPNAKPTGLGDTIARVTSAIGVKPCPGCIKRQAFVNWMVPYRR